MKKKRVKCGHKYWAVAMWTKGIIVYYNYDKRETKDDNLFNCGNYFHSKEEAETIANKIRAVFDGAHIIKMPTEEDIKIKIPEIVMEPDDMPPTYHYKLGVNDGLKEGIEWMKNFIIQ